MTEVAYGNPDAMSETQDISTHERLEGFASPGLPPCPNASLGGTVQNPVIIAAGLNVEFEGGVLEKTIPESSIQFGEAAAGHGEVTPLAEKLKVLVGGGGYSFSLDSPLRCSVGVKESPVNKSVLDVLKPELVEKSPTPEISALEPTARGTSVLDIASVDTFSLENLIKDTSVVIRSTVETHAVDPSTAKTLATEFPVMANLKDDTALSGECSHFGDFVQGVVPGASRMGRSAQDVIIKAKPIDEYVDQDVLPSPSKNYGLDVAPITKELPLVGIEKGDLKPLDEIEVVQIEESRMDEEVPITDHTVPLATTGIIKFGNVVNNITDIITVSEVETAEKLLGDTGDRQVDDMGDRMANTLADGMAYRMADAIADEIADQIADRMADEIADKMADEMADGIADTLADRMADEMADRMADDMTDRMADDMADKMADEIAAEVADELADEVVEMDHGRGKGQQESERLNDGEAHESSDRGEEEMGEDANTLMDDDNYEDDEGSPAEQLSFVRELERFFQHRNLEYKAPKFYGLELNVLKLWRVVSRCGGYDHVTGSKLWRTVGEEFKPPKTCTTISWSFRGFYEKALLDYERFKTGITAPDNCQLAIQAVGCYLRNDQRTASPATPSSDPNVVGTPGSGSGRARRDAAARAMRGWHSQRVGNGDAKEPNSKDKGSGGKHVKKEKKLTNLGGSGLKRKGSKTVLERAVKAVQARGRPSSHEESLPSNSAVTGKRSMKHQDPGRRPSKVAKVDGAVNGFDPPILDEGPKADWVKINVHKHLDCFEIYALVPGLAREEVRIQCEPGGRLVIAGMPEDPENPWGVTPFRKVICLPSRIDAHQTSAVVTLYGQLYVRVPIAEDKSS